MHFVSFIFSNEITGLPHKFKLSIRWDEAYAMLSLKLAQLDTLMELTIINGNRCFTSSEIFKSKLDYASHHQLLCLHLIIKTTTSPIKKNNNYNNSLTASDECCQSSLLIFIQVKYFTFFCVF